MFIKVGAIARFSRPKFTSASASSYEPTVNSFRPRGQTGEGRGQGQRAKGRRSRARAKAVGAAKVSA